MKRILTSLLLAVALCGGLLTITGCHSLDPAGVYQGDKVLYDADTMIALSYDTVHTFVSWEYTNRATLTKMPQVKEAADNLRLNFPIWFKAAISARTVYTQSKTQANADALSLTLSVLRNAMTQAQTWIANGATYTAAPLTQ